MTSPIGPASIDRREALRRAALLLGGVLSAPLAAGVLAGCEARGAPDGTWRPRALTPDQQRALLERLDREAAPFFRSLKELTLVGYYTSEIGATRELHHAPVPGRYDGCVPLAQVGRTWAV